MPDYEPLSPYAHLNVRTWLYADILKYTLYLSVQLKRSFNVR